MAAGGELDGIADEVQQNLPQPHGITDDPIGNMRLDLRGEQQALMLRLHLK